VGVWYHHQGVGPYLNVFLNRGETFWLVVRCVYSPRGPPLSTST
jgi:hypothetical protein